MNIRRPALAFFAALAVAMCSVVFTMSATATSETCGPTGDETLNSDKDDYQPGHTVHIGGAGFAPGCDVVIRVTRPSGTVLKGDGSLEPGSDTVTTDDDGNLAYDYVLTAAEGESLIGDYLVEALGENGAVLVSYGFTDGLVAGREGTAPWAGTCLNPDQAVVEDALNGDNPGNRAECDSGETVIGSGFDLQSVVPSSATEIGFVITVQGRVSAIDGDDTFDVSLSGDQGNNYTAVTASEPVNANFTTEANVDAPNTSGPCQAGSTFGKTWTYGEISDANFRVQVAAHPRDGANADAPAQDMQIDDVDVSVCWASRTITKARGGAATPLGNVGASLTVDHTGNDALDGVGTTSEDWMSTSYQIGAGPVVCVDTPNNIDSGADTESFLVPAPATEGSHDLTLIAYSDDGGPGVGCGDRASTPVTTEIVVGIFGESFGTEAVANYELAGDVDNPNWDDGDAGGTNCRTDHLDVGGALAGYTHLRLRGTPTDCAATYTGISTVGRTDIHLKYKWGQSTDADATDDGDLLVQWKLNSVADLPANWLPSVSTHDLAPNTTSDPDANSVDVDLGPTAENTMIDIRFVGATDEAADQARVDDVLVTGAPPNTPPTCDDPQSDDVDEDGTLNGAVSCDDVDLDPLTYSLVSDVSNGTLTFNPDGTFEYEPDPDFNGADSFTFKADDGTADSNTATFNITVNAVNDPPTCVDPQSDSVDEDQQLIGAVSCGDVDSGSLTYELVDDVTNGTLVLNPDGTFTYDPDPDYNGSDSFTFKADDGFLESNTATFNITVNAVNDPPTCDDDSNSTNQDTPFNDTLACDDIDVGDDLDYTVTDPPDNGDLTAFDSETGDFTYTPDPGYSGPDSFKFKANDGTADSNEATFDITVIPVDSDGDGLNDNVDCRDNLGDDRAVGLSPVPPGFTGTVHPTLQAAVNAASDDDVITMYVNTTENVAVNGNKDLRIEGCGHKVTAASGASPAIRVLVTAGKNDGNTGAGERDIHIGDLDVRGATSSSGYLVETTKTTTGTSTILKAVRSENNSIGIKIAGHGNHLRSTNSTRYNSSDGIQVTGNSNLIESNHVGPNTGDGIEVTGNKNTIKDNDVDSSGGDGIKVASNGNSLSENDSDGNMGDGFDVSGGTAASPNTLFKNAAGVNAYNKGNGFLIAGAGNGTPNPVELAENEAANNKMNGFRVTGTGHELGKNKAWANVLCEYSVVAGNFNSKDNKKNNTTVLPNTDGAAFPTACQE